MDTSYLTNLTLPFKPVAKDRLFYDQFEYCIGFQLAEISALRELDHAVIDDIIERRKQWREIAQQRWVKGQRPHGAVGTIMSRSWRDITAQTQADLHTLADVLLTTSAEYKLVVSINQGYVYTNQLALIDQLAVMPELSKKTYTHARIIRPKNTIQLKNPRHEYRTYFRAIKLSAQEKRILIDFLQNQQSHARMSPGLKNWVDDPFTRTQDYFFMDHNGSSWLSMLSLVRPGIIRKTLQIVAAK
jgi:hypothetical protein